MIQALIRLTGFALLACGLAIGCKKQTGSAAQVNDKKVNLLVFSEYIPDDVLADFKKETGIEANVAVLGSNEELVAKLHGGGNEFDVVSPSDYMVRRLASQGLIQKLDRMKLPNFKNLDPGQLGKSFDPGNETSVPLFWGTTGIGYNKSKVAGPIDSWGALFDARHKGQVVMLNDPREMVAAALRTAGKDPNTRDPAQLQAAIELLKKQKKEVNPLYDIDGVYEKLQGGDVALAQGFNGQFYKVIADKPDELGYVIPKEGATIWIDNLAVPTASTRVANAHLLIDFLMRPDIAARMANFAAYATPNKAALEQVKPELRNNPIIYPPAEVLQKCATMDDMGAEANKIVDRVATEINAE